MPCWPCWSPSSWWPAAGAGPARSRRPPARRSPPRRRRLRRQRHRARAAAVDTDRQHRSPHPPVRAEAAPARGWAGAARPLLRRHGARRCLGGSLGAGGNVVGGGHDCAPASERGAGMVVDRRPLPPHRFAVGRLRRRRGQAHLRHPIAGHLRGGTHPTPRDAKDDRSRRGHGPGGRGADRGRRPSLGRARVGRRRWGRRRAVTGGFAADDGMGDAGVGAGRVRPSRLRVQRRQRSRTVARRDRRRPAAATPPTSRQH